MTVTKRSHLAAWRDAVRDSDLDAKAKLVCHTVSTYMSASGAAFPSRATLAAGCSVSVRTVERALIRIEAAGFLGIRRSHGRHSNRYAALIPATASQRRRSAGANSDKQDAQRRHRDASTATWCRLNGDMVTPESSKESINEGSKKAERPELPFELERTELPFEKERQIERLMKAIGSDADAGTEGVVRSLASKLGEGQLVKVLESVRANGARNRARYVVASLKAELNGKLSGRERQALARTAAAELAAQVAAGFDMGAAA